MRTFSIWQWGRALSCAEALLGCGDDAEITSPNEDGGLDLGPDSGGDGDGDGDEVLACPEMLGAGATTEVSNEYAIGIGPFFMLAAGDVDGDGVGEVVVDRDTLLSQGDFSYMEGDAEIECGDAASMRSSS